MRVWLLTAAILVVSVPAASAQGQSQAPSVAPSPSEPAQNIPDQKLDAAAAAITKVNRLSKDYKQKFDNAAPDDRERIVNEADAAIEQAVKQSGLSVEEYNQIIDVALNDPATQSRILQRLQTLPDEQ